MPPKKEVGYAASDMLTSKDEIKTAFNLSEYMFWEWIEQGMPALYIKGRWSASISAIQEWWRRTRSVTMGSIVHKIRADEERNTGREIRPE